MVIFDPDPLLHSLIAYTRLNKEAKTCSLLHDVIHESPLAVNILEIKVLKEASTQVLCKSIIILIIHSRKKMRI